LIAGRTAVMLMVSIYMEVPYGNNWMSCWF
jgi:hypothetical protein